MHDGCMKPHFGIRSLATASILLCATVFAAQHEPHAQQAAKQPTPAQRAFDLFKGMAGMWEGKDASSGRNIKIEFKVIANGSVVMATSDYDAHPDEQMVTMYSLDQGKLILTHYCVARNQPRLVAEKISDDGRTIEFKFKDGTGMKDVNTGHMHNVKVWFIGKDEFKDQWSFYKDGKETFMEDFTMRRVKSKSQR